MHETLRRLFLEGKLKGPSQKGFDPQQWQATFRQIPSPSTADQRHFEAALWFGEQFNQLRAYFDANPLPPGSPEEVLRRVVGVVNRECLTAINTAQQTLTASQGPVTASDIIEGRITLAGNVNKAPPAQLIESAIDGLRFDLEALQRPRTSLSEFDVPKQLLHLRRRVNFTIAYHILEEEWLECILQGWIVNTADSDTIQLRPGDPESAIARVVSEYRDGMLLQEMNSLARSIFNKHSAVRDRVLRSKVVRWRGPEGTLVLGYPSKQMAFPIYVSRLSATEPDLEPFTQEPLSHRGGLTLLQLVNAWAALASISWDLSSQIPLIDIDNPSQFERFAPLLPMDALISTLSAATELTPSQCETVIDTLTWRTVRDSLWFRPLVKAGDKHRIVVIPALRAPNRVWLRS
ncbi:hypothetical protein [Myxococcus fulvus]|uniref:hypothetical protein n=1 Tax=Myxococcus fulvus TaxID=33 RepID=UPI0020C09CD1|nr:hypothetical protein [Myxococcus fulvus]MCK8503238.1 hypothetical protein [Myxococcus fulvus]